MLDRVRKYFVSVPFTERVDLSGKKIIVTGAAQGSLGYETARILAGWGACIIITTRKDPEWVAVSIKEQLLAEGTNAQIDSHSLDLGDEHSVVDFSRWYMENHGDRLDVLVNNAGIHCDLLSQWKEPNLSSDGFEIQWRINYLGTQHLTHLFLPLLKITGLEVGEARIVNVSSQLHARGENRELFETSKPYNSWDAYGQSKLALVHSTFEIERRYAKEFNLHAYCLHPGSVFTNVADKGLDGNWAIQNIRNAMAPVEAFFLMTPEEGAQTQIYCATHSGLQGGAYYAQSKPDKVNKEAKVPAVSKRLWDTTEKWIDTLATA